MRSIKAFVGKFGYYIALLVLVAVIGATAYLIRNDSGESLTESPPKRVINSLDETVAARPSTSKLIWPVSSRAVITPHSPDEPVWSETLEMYHTHEGVDIAAVLGEAVRAAMKGSVTAAYRDDMLGNTVEIKHEGGIKTIYSNLSTLNLVKLGQTVRQGEIIGAVGEDARLEIGLGPHIHFEAYENGVWMELPPA